MSTTSTRRGVLRRLGARGDDRGAAIVIVMGSMLVLGMLAMVALAFTVNSKEFARYTQDYGGAMAAAQSGVDDFISRLNRDDAYAETWDCANEAWRGPTTQANPCGWTTATEPGWIPVQATATDPEAARFTYSVDMSRASSEGIVVLTSTGRVNGEFRTIQATIAKGASTDYVYYTDFESADPKNIQAYRYGHNTSSRTGTDKVECGSEGHGQAAYWYSSAKGTRNGKNCVEIQFAENDTLVGSVYSNDAILSYGATFEDSFTSLNPGCASVTNAGSTWRNCLRQGTNSNSSGNKPLNSHATFAERPQRAQDKYDLDDTSAAFASKPGCHYYGSTRIVFNSNGTMRVWNKTSSNGNTAPVARGSASQPAPTSCGSLSDLNSPGGALVNVPQNMVIYAAQSSAPGRQCYAGQLGGPSGRTLPLGTFSSSIPSNPSSGSPRYDADVNMTEPDRECNRGNLYVEGVVKGRVTLAAHNSIIVTGDIVLASGRDSTEDLVGLIASNSVEVMNPRLAEFRPTRVGATCSDTGSTWRYCQNGGTSKDNSWPTRYNDPTTGTRYPSNGLQIAGSIQTLDRSFYVQRYWEGDERGDLFVFGSIAQRWRGIVMEQRTSWTGVVDRSGYFKDYRYDERLAITRPPHFPRWENAQWALRYSGEISTPAILRT